MGTLQVIDAKKFEGKTCEWIIDGSNSSEMFIYLIIQQNLFDNELNIFHDDKDLLFSSYYSASPGVILIGSKYKRINVKMVIRGKYDDILTIQYSTDGKIIHIDNIVDNIGYFLLPHPNNIDLGIGTIDFKINLSADSNIKNFLFTMDYIQLDNGSISVDKINKYKRTNTFTEENKTEIMLSTNNVVFIEVQ